jgi:hypothetical protein
MTILNRTKTALEQIAHHHLPRHPKAKLNLAFLVGELNSLAAFTKEQRYRLTGRFHSYPPWRAALNRWSERSSLRMTAYHIFGVSFFSRLDLIAYESKGINCYLSLTSTGEHHNYSHNQETNEYEPYCIACLWKLRGWLLPSAMLEAAKN